MAKDRKHKPDFSKAFEHVVIHPGAKAVIDVVRKALGFGDKAAIPSLKMLERFGNTSTSSIFYILAYIETFQGLQKGDRVLQMAMGSGFKYVLPSPLSLCACVGARVRSCVFFFLICIISLSVWLFGPSLSFCSLACASTLGDDMTDIPALIVIKALL